MSSDPVIAVEDLGKSYEIAPAGSRPTTLRDALVQRLRHPLRAADTDTFWALRGVSLSVARGEVIGVIGGNGAGKSTLLKILCRITEPTEGVATLRGRVGSLLEVGTGFHPELTGRENVYLNGAILGMQRAEIERRFDEIVDFSGVSRFLDTPVKRYSSGMYVRLAFAVAAHLEPEILLVDEVLAVGDAEFQERCLGKMEQAATEEGRTILFVSHNMAAIESLCTRAVYMAGGRVGFDGPVHQAITEYLDGSGDHGHGSLRQRVNAHHPAGVPLVEQVEVVGEGSASADAVRIGTNVSIRLRCRGLQHVDRPVVGVRIRSTFHGVVTSASTRMSPMTVPDVESEALDVVLALDDLTLAPGRYWIDFTVKDGRTGDKVDAMEAAAGFSIVASDLYGSGYELAPADGILYVRHRWHVEPADDLTGLPPS